MDVDEDRELLPQNALKGVSVGISVSESADLSQLGLVENHFRLAIAEIARTVLVSGGDIFYGGHLRPHGYTVFLLEELQKYGRRDRPLKVCLNWAEHQLLSDEELEVQRENLGLSGELIFLSADDSPVQLTRRTEDRPTEFSADEKTQALSALRRFLAENTRARIVLGGFQGAIPGLIEEALFSVESGNPLYLAGGFGGVTLDLLEAINPELVSWFPARNTEPDERLQKGISNLREAIERTGWRLDGNGLTNEENALLAATYRPSEIAALVGLGLGRLNLRD